jgi:hypothetical protein
MPMTEAKMNKPAPLIPTKTRTLCFVLGFFLDPSLGVESGEGLGAMGDPVGVDTIVGGLAGTVEAGVGAKIGEVEGARKILEGDCDGEDTGDSNEDGDREIDDGDGDNGESDGANKGESGDSDGDGGRV